MSKILIMLLVGITASFVINFLMIIPVIPGALLASLGGSHGWIKGIGWLTCVAGRTYICLTLTAWATIFVRGEISPGNGVLVICLAWFVAFLISNAAAWRELRTSHELVKSAIQRGDYDEGISFNQKVNSAVVLFCFVGFFILAFAPSIAQKGWGWIPYVVTIQ